jgi:hypothetical protein
MEGPSILIDIDYDSNTNVKTLIAEKPVGKENTIHSCLA